MNWQLGQLDIEAQVKANAAAYNTQSAFSRITEKAAKLSGTAAAISQAVPGIGTVVGGVLAAVSVVTGLVSKIFGKSKAKAYAAERAEWEKVNAQLQDENDELDSQIEQLSSQVQSFKLELDAKKAEVTKDIKFTDGRDAIRLKLSTSLITSFSPSTAVSRSMSGMGFSLPCIIGCKKKREKKALEATKEEYQELIGEQKEKLATIEALMDKFNQLAEESKLIDEVALRLEQKREVEKQVGNKTGMKKKLATISGGIAVIVALSILGTKFSKI